MCKNSIADEINANMDVTWKIEYCFYYRPCEGHWLYVHGCGYAGDKTGKVDIGLAFLIIHIRGWSLLYNRGLSSWKEDDKDIRDRALQIGNS